MATTSSLVTPSHMVKIKIETNMYKMSPQDVILVSPISSLMHFMVTGTTSGRAQTAGMHSVIVMLVFLNSSVAK